MKKCPRCKTPMVKSHSQKMICRACGFVTRDLQVARDNQQFQQRHNFSKKITIVRSNNEPTKTVPNIELKKHYLTCFQGLLRSTANYLSKSNKQFSNIDTQVRQIWFNYCGLVARCGPDISGIFARSLKEPKQNQPADKLHKEQEQQPDPEEKKQEQVPHTQRDQSSLRGPKKRGLKAQKKISVKKNVKLHLKELQSQQREGMSAGQQRSMFLKYICRDLWEEEDIDASTIEYISNKYAVLLVRQICSGLGGFGVSEAKGLPFKVTNRHIEQLANMRQLKIKDRKQIILLLLLQDLLREWSVELSLENEYSLSDLLLLYDTEENKEKRNLITATIEQVKREMKTSKQPQSQNKQAFPELSFNLAYAILYLASLASCCTLSINDIVVLASRSMLQLEFQGRKIESEEKICINKIRTTAAKLVKLMQMKCQPTPASLNKWVEKYAKVCGLTERLNFITKLTDTFHKALQNREHAFMGNQFVEQDIIAKSIIIIFIKLEQGFQSYPYLSRIPAQLVHRLETSPKIGKADKYVKFIKQIPTEASVSIAQILESLQEKYGSHSSTNCDLKQKLTPTSYSSLSFLTLLQLKMLTKKCGGFANFSGNFARLRISCEQNKWGRFENKEELGLVLSKLLRKQVQVAMDEQKNNVFRVEDLDLPSSNYEFFYEYASNIKHAGRDLFVMLTEKLAGGECPISNLYSWIENLEKIMIDFEN